MLRGVTRRARRARGAIAAAVGILSCSCSLVLGDDLSNVSGVTEQVDARESDASVDGSVSSPSDASSDLEASSDARLEGATRWSGNGHSYRAVVLADAITWTQARDRAIADGGYLVTITSDGERDFVGALVPSSAFARGSGPWIGAYQTRKDAEPGGGWAWVTDELWGYTSWKAGEPTDGDGTEDYAHLFGSTTVWNDIELDGNAKIIAYVVEFD